MVLKVNILLNFIFDFNVYWVRKLKLFRWVGIGVMWRDIVVEINKYYYYNSFLKY